MERRSFITKLSVLAPAALAAPRYLFAGTGDQAKAESTEVLVISLSGENTSLQQILLEQQPGSVFIRVSDGIRKTEQTADGFRVYLPGRVIEAKQVMLDVPVNVDEDAKKVRMTNDSSVSFCFRRKGEQTTTLRSVSRQKLNAADVEMVLRKKSQKLIVLK